MLSLTNPRIVQFVAHVVDPKTGTLRLSNAETPVGTHSGFPHDFFQRHILHAISAKNRRLATYRSPGSGVVERAFADLRERKQDLVNASALIAKHLERRVASSAYKARIKPGDLMVAVIREDSVGVDGPPYLAILKIEPLEAMIRRRKTEDGRTWVEFKEDTRTPSEVEGGEPRPQKIALLSDRREAEPEPFDLVVLDYQLSQKGIAQFSYRDFLESELTRDPSEMTQQLLRELKSVLHKPDDRLTRPLTPTEKLDALNRGEECIARRKNVSPSTLAAQALALPKRTPDERSALQQKLLSRLEGLPRGDRRVRADESVEVVSEIARPTKRRYVLDAGVELSGSPEALAQMLSIEGPDAENRYTLTLRTTKFEVG